MRHVEWLTGDTSRACAVHWPEIEGDWHFRDSHPFGGACDIPGSDWVYSTDERDGYCVLPSGPGFEMRGEVEVPRELEVV